MSVRITGTDTDTKKPRITMVTTTPPATPTQLGPELESFRAGCEARQRA